MAEESIGALVPTKIPGYEDAADIQAALRVYHYGDYDYDPANTSTALLVNPSIAYTINDLQDQINAIDSGGIEESIFTAKGDILSASAASTPLILSVGTNNQFLVANSATGTGLQWTNTLTSPTIISPTVSGLYLSDSSIVFEGSADEYETTLLVSNPTADRSVTIPDATGTLILDTATQTLSNKTLTAPIINLSLNAQTGTDYTTVLSDNGKLVTLSNASPITLTVPANTSVAYSIGAQINITQIGAGQVTVAGTGGVTVNATPGLKLRAQWSAATLIKIDTDSWLLTGDLSE
jgi:hypothetical protein